MRILITCFMPFRDREKNGSQILARFIQSHNQTDEIRVVDIPVRWGAVESTTCSMIEDWKPDIIMGLGEGGERSIVLETTGRNTREGKDVDGALPPADYIVQNGDPLRYSSFSFSWTPQIHLPISLEFSLDAGAYLCNNALYHFCGTGCTRVGFIHVPPQKDMNDAPYSALYGPIILEMLSQNKKFTFNPQLFQETYE